MPLTSLHEEIQPLYSDRAGTPFDSKNVREYTMSWRVVMVHKTSDVLVVCSCPGLPFPFSSYYSITEVGVFVYDLPCLMVNMSAKQDQDNPFLWIVTCRYSTEMPAGGAASFPGYPATVGSRTGGGAANNPELEPPEISWDYEIVQEARYADLDGKLYHNSAHQPFTPAPTTPVAYPILTISRNELDFNIGKAGKYAYAVNSKKFLGYPVETVQCMPITARQMYRGHVGYARVTYKFKFQIQWIDNVNFDPPQEVWGTWQPKILDNGTCKLDTNPASKTFNKPIPITRFGAVITQPVPLNLLGQELDLPGGVGTNNVGMLPAKYREFRQYQGRDFNQLLITGV